MEYFFSWSARLFEPVGLVAWCLLFIVLIVYRLDKTRHLFVSSLSLLIVYLLLASPFLANLLTAALETRSPLVHDCAMTGQSAPVVVLAGGISGDKPEQPAYSILKERSYRRLVSGVHLAAQQPDTLLILSGGGWETLKEADLMADLAIALGFPPQRIIRESLSSTTRGNAVQVAAILRQNNLTRIWLVTSAMHMPRAAAVFAHEGIQVCPYPVDVRWVSPRIYDMFVPQVSALQKTTDALHELLGFLWYMLRGWI